MRVYRSLVWAAVTLAVPACAAHSVPSTGDALSSSLPPVGAAGYKQTVDTKSVLKGLNKDVIIGRAVDRQNGDQSPRELTTAGSAHGGALTKGELVFCNFEDSSGKPGAGTTIEGLDPTPGSSPKRFAQSALLRGCDGVAIHPIDGTVYGSGLTSGDVLEMGKKGGVIKSYGSKVFASPFSDFISNPPQNFSPLYVYVGTTRGTIVSISVGFYGNGLATEVIKGFAATSGSKGGLAPSGFEYDRSSDTLYVVDGADNTIVSFFNASDLLDKDEIIVKPGGKTFKCKYPKTTCGTLVYSGSPLDAPIASALFPNGNLVVANTRGTANTLVELTPTGQVLDTKVVDKSSTQGVYGLVAHGTNDRDTVLYYTDTNDNSVHELTR